MDRTRTLAFKSLLWVFISILLILLCSAPLLFKLMERNYTEDLDELIVFRLYEFKKDKLPSFKTDDIAQWNSFNEDVFILPYDKKHLIGKVSVEEIYSEAEGHNIDYRIVYDEIIIDNKPYILMSRIPMIEKHDLMKTLLSQYGFLFFVILISLPILFYYISKRLWKPFYSTLAQIQHFNLEKGELPQFIDSQTTEFVQLNAILTNLISDNINSYKKQKEFIQNASHELQTPLAVFKSQLDMLLQHPDLSKGQVEIIQSLYSVSSRMTRLNKNLLLLARIENDQYGDMENLDFVQTLYAQLLFLRERAENNGLKVNVKIKNSLTVYANKILVESLITNLIVNAIRHNIKNGVVDLEVVDSYFVVANTGNPTALDNDKIFRRFSRFSEEKKGNGLGLSIVFEICKLHRWKIDYNFHNKTHIFTINFT